MTRFSICLLIALAIPSAAAAQVQNGSFDSGAASWESSDGWTFPTEGGRPGAHAFLPNGRGGWMRQTFTIDASLDAARVVAFDYKVVMFEDGDDAHSAYPVMSVKLVGELEQPVHAQVGEWQTVRLDTTGGEHTFVLTALSVYGTMTLDVDNVRIESSVAADSPSWGEIKSQYD